MLKMLGAFTTYDIRVEESVMTEAFFGILADPTAVLDVSGDIIGSEWIDGVRCWGSKKYVYRAHP